MDSLVPKCHEPSSGMEQTVKRTDSGMLFLPQPQLLMRMFQASLHTAPQHCPAIVDLCK